MKGIGRIIEMREVGNIERKDCFFTSAPFCSSPTGQCEEWCQHVHAGGNLGARGAGFMEMALLKFTDTIKSSVFGHERDMHKIASNGSYVIDGTLLTVDYWQQGLVLEHLFIEHFAVWIRIHGLPLECYTEEAGFRSGQVVGEVIWIDLDPVLQRNIHFLLWIPMEKPLIRGFFLKFWDGRHQWIAYSYERVASEDGSLHKHGVEHDTSEGKGESGQPVHRGLESLSDEPVNLVGEMELLWNIWANRLQALGINAGQLVMYPKHSEVMDQLRGVNSFERMDIVVSGQNCLVGVEETIGVEDTINTIRRIGLGRRLNIPLKESLIRQRALSFMSP
ncbi:hypothetical protein LOK49_LG02G02194 [Camellia lanceoleosa]|uniref:Uncharacterized protein n=1 Tax=Camellia lanceoleosa TaxID=1840588 RepID=A0ACC0ISA6_9ERIC|nr:hypothetical protein LOK49_LG02G02194 [Camellia lanceoleosa]